MSPALPADGLEAMEAVVDRALVAGHAGDLRVLGYGEISLVIAWEHQGRRFACKRLPPFPSQEAFTAYRASVDAYIDALQQRGIHPVETAVQQVRRSDGLMTAYCVQEILPDGSLLTDHMQTCCAEESLGLYARILDALEGCITDRLGIDSQLSNWALVDGELLYLDTSTPMMRDDQGREVLDTDIFLASLPWALRGLVRRFLLRSILDKYYDVRGAALDLVGNLTKERLEPLLQPFMELANDRIEPDLTPAEIASYYRWDARMWRLLQFLRQLDRFWQRRLLRRTYPFLLPERIERHV